ncbi:MAG: SDR family NAD(P)-dependent oxidoreductase, partial [Chloroflexota bacterium]
TLSFEESLYTLRVNAVAPVMVARAFVPLLRNGDNRRLVSITSQLGSLERKQSGGLYDYCASKAALNMYTRTLAADLKSDGITTVMIHPGWVQTDMGGRSADLTPEESAAAVVNVIDGLTPEMNGGFYRQDGSQHPW